MNRILTISDELDLQEISAVAARYPAGLRDDVQNAFQAAQAKDYEKAAALCRSLLEHQTDPDIRMLLGTCLFIQDDMDDARDIFFGLTADYPETEEYLIYLGMTDHALGHFEEAVRELGSLYPLKTYRPFYYSSYADSLQQLGMPKQSREAFYQEIAFFENTGIIPSPLMLDGAFQNLLYLDVTLGNGKYPKDILLYYRFLDQVEMTEEMRTALSDNVIYFQHLMSNKSYRPLFLSFLTHIRDKGWLNMEPFSKILDSAFLSWENWQLHDDRQISHMMEAFLVSGHEKRHPVSAIFWEAERKPVEATALTYCWYMCQYVPEHPDELDYVKNTYPRIYADNQDFFEKMKNDPDETAEQILDELLLYTPGTPRDEFLQSMRCAYVRACEEKKQPVYVYDGQETYRRIQPKVGRNDPCPCGSGKKYKKCCGKGE